MAAIKASGDLSAAEKLGGMVSVISEPCLRVLLLHCTPSEC
jgi:hypothetical protein